MTIEVTRFDNGIRLVTERMDATLSASIGVWIERGARHETAEENGIAHFLEHMAFKGTARRSALDIAEEIENVGGYLNAYTAREATAYYARVLGEDVPLALDVLSDILLHPKFRAEDIEVERGVILQEIGQSLDTPDDVIFDWLSEESFPEQPLGRPILGSTENVRRFDRANFQNFVEKNYGGENMIIAAAGAVDHQALARDIENQFAGLSYQSATHEEAPSFAHGQKRVQKDLEQVHFALSLDAPSIKDDRFFAAQLLSNMLGGGMSSRLFQSIREQRGLCYTIFSSLSALKDNGQLMIYSGTSADGIDELMGETAKEMKKFASTLRHDELARAKAQMRAGTVMALEDVGNRNERLARQMMVHNEIIPIEESLRKIEAVTIDDIASLAQTMFAEKPQMVLYGPISRARDFDGLMAELI